MRIWGRIKDDAGFYTKWVEVTPDPVGYPDYVYITNLIQVLKLNLGESPFFANYGIPAQRSVIQQIFPDFYVNQTQAQFSQYFSTLSITKLNLPEPTYNVNLTTTNGTKVQTTIAV